MSGPPRSTDPDDWAPDDVPDHARRTADGDATGPHHALPRYWHGVTTSPGEWRRIHLGDVVAVQGLAVFVAAFGAVLVGRFGLAYLATCWFATSMGLALLSAPAERVRVIQAAERDPHRSNPYRWGNSQPYRVPETPLPMILLGSVLFLLGGGLLAVALLG
jgi:hypothetical protein